MKKLFALAFLLLWMAGVVVAQAPGSVCVAALSGPQASSWNLQKPIAREISEQAASRHADLTSQLLTANDEKKAKVESRERSCTYLLLPWWEAGDSSVNFGLNPSERAPRASITDTAATVGSQQSGARLQYKLFDAQGKKIASGHFTLELKPSPVREDYEAAGGKLVSQVAGAVLKTLVK